MLRGVLLFQGLLPPTYDAGERKGYAEGIFHTDILVVYMDMPKQIESVDMPLDMERNLMCKVFDNYIIMQGAHKSSEWSIKEDRSHSA